MIKLEKAEMGQVENNYEIWYIMNYIIDFGGTHY